MKNYFLFAVGSIMAWVIIISQVALSSFPYNPLSPDHTFKTHVMSFIPEGWGFFTRNAREEDLFVYEHKESGWKKNKHMPISSRNNTFGLNRLPRAQSVELAMLLSQVPETTWKDCAVNTDFPNITDTASVQVDNPSPHPILKGKLCIIKQQPVPWAWAGNKNNLQIPSKYLIIYVKG